MESKIEVRQTMVWTGLETMEKGQIIKVPCDLHRARTAAGAYSKKLNWVFVAFLNNNKTFIQRVR